MRGARLRKGRGARDAEHDLRFRIEHAAGALRRARIGRATHWRGWQAARDPFRTATADRVEWPVPVSRRWWQRWRRRPGCRAQHGIVSRDRLAARLRGGDNGRGPSGADARVRSRSHRARRSCLRGARTDSDDRLRDHVALLRPRTRSQILRRLLGRRAAGHDVRAAVSGVLRWHRDLRARDERLERRDDRRGVGHADVSLDCARERAGQRILSRAISDSDLSLVARGITTACDAADGATDGMVLRPEACRFDPKRLQCAAAKDADCLTAAQVAALERTFAGPRDSSGRTLYVGQAVGSRESPRRDGGSGSWAHRRRAARTRRTRR